MAHLDTDAAMHQLLGKFVSYFRGLWESNLETFDQWTQMLPMCYTD